MERGIARALKERDNVAWLDRKLRDGFFQKEMERNMALDITIKGIPEEVYARLSARAEVQEKSVEEFLHEELRKIAQPLAKEEWLDEVRKLKERDPTRVPSEVIVQFLREDRK